VKTRKETLTSGKKMSKKAKHIFRKSGEVFRNQTEVWGGTASNGGPGEAAFRRGNLSSGKKNRYGSPSKKRGEGGASRSAVSGQRAATQSPRSTW